MELRKADSNLLGQESSKKPSWYTKKEKPLQQLEEQIPEKAHNLEKHQSLIFNLDSSLSSCRTPLLVQSLRAQEANKKLVAERLEIEKLKKRAHLLDRSLITEVATRDVSIEQLRGDLHELKVLYRGVAEAANVQTLKIASMEERLQDQQESQDTMEERLHAVTGELNETAEIVEKATYGINCLHAELRNVQEEADSSKGESVKRLETLEKMVPVLNKELNEVIHQWPKFFSPPSTTCTSCKCSWHIRSIA
jgi:chromosome segregation ATPase